MTAGPRDVSAPRTPLARAARFDAGWMERVARATAADHDVEGISASGLELAQLRGLFRVAFCEAQIGMAVVDLDDRIIIANPALGRLVGRTPDELAAHSIADMLTPEDVELCREGREALAAGEQPSYEGSVRLRHANGPPLWASLTASHEAGVTTLIYQFQDISQRRELEGRLRHLVDHDLLTGLLNRHRFEQELTQQLRRQRRYGDADAGPGTVLMIDLDGFKAVNDRFGHAAGDELLRAVAADLQRRTRETDVLARLSGDEFAMLLPDSGRAAAEVVAASVVGVVKRHVSILEGQIAQVTASVGVAEIDKSTSEEVLALADAAMYAAKQAGGNRFVVFEPATPRVDNSRQVAEAIRLRDALADHRFVLHAQPIWNLAEDRVEMYELLIRMRDAGSDELIAPHAFLDAAERFGLIQAIDSWVVSEAVKLVAEQAARGHRVVLSINLSGRSVGDPALDAHIDAALSGSGIDPSCLVFELTETAAIGNIEAAVAFSRHLRTRGCRFALDDFGAGFASFYYLKKIPFDYLKIDGDFVRNISTSPIDQLLVAAIVDIAAGLGKETIAEFVTDQEISDKLRASGVDYAQGFHVGRPGPIADVMP